jgi:hypothetical protein
MQEYEEATSHTATDPIAAANRFKITGAVIVFVCVFGSFFYVLHQATRTFVLGSTTRLSGFTGVVYPCSKTLAL